MSSFLLVVLISLELSSTDTGMGIRYDTYRIRGYTIFQKTSIRGYGYNILIKIKIAPIGELNRQQEQHKKFPPHLAQPKTFPAPW
jgi:hypothetical protein